MPLPPFKGVVEGWAFSPESVPLTDVHLYCSVVCAFEPYEFSLSRFKVIAFASSVVGSRVAS